MVGDDPREHVDHADLLLTGCMHTLDDGSRAMRMALAFPATDLSAADLMATAEALAFMAYSVSQLGKDKASAN